MEVVKNLQVTVPFTELITQVPSYAKFLKDILTRKRSIGNVETIAFTEGSSAFLQSKAPPKKADPGSFSISCTIGTVFIDKALCDLGASVSVMPYSVCEKLNMGKLKCTSVTLQMADRSVRRPMGILEDVPVKIGKFFIPVDFIVLDMAEDLHIPIILGRPFLHTAGAIIDVKNGSLTLEVGDDKVTFNLSKAMKSPMIEEECYYIDVIDTLVEDSLPRLLGRDLLDECLCLDTCADELSNEEEAVLKLAEKALDGAEELSLDEEEALMGLMEMTCAVEVSATEPKNNPELKPLPPNLKYAFLDETKAYPVIVNVNLSEPQLDALLVVLRKHKKALGYSLDDLKGISPDFCMHRIHLDDGHRPSIQSQRRLNPNMQEVVRKEVMKLLDAGIIYAISDSNVNQDKWGPDYHRSFGGAGGQFLAPPQASGSRVARAPRVRRGGRGGSRGGATRGGHQGDGDDGDEMEI